MNFLPAAVAILAFISTAKTADDTNLAPCLKHTDFRKFSHCITKRQACNRGDCSQRCNEGNCGRSCNGGDCGRSCNNCQTCEDNSCRSCNNCGEGRGYDRDFSETRTNSNNNNNLDVSSKLANVSPLDNKVHLTLYNRVHNYNNISNPIEIVNTNHFNYNGSAMSSTKCQNGGECKTSVEPITPYRGCARSIRPPMIVPPYMPPPPPCYRTHRQPYMSCNISPAPYVAPTCAPCFYCGGQYNPGLCSSQQSCNQECRTMECNGQPCYPQLQPQRNPPCAG